MKRKNSPLCQCWPGCLFWSWFGLVLRLLHRPASYLAQADPTAAEPPAPGMPAPFDLPLVAIAPTMAEAVLPNVPAKTPVDSHTIDDYARAALARARRKSLLPAVVTQSRAQRRLGCFGGVCEFTQQRCCQSLSGA